MSAIDGSNYSGIAGSTSSTIASGSGASKFTHAASGKAPLAGPQHPKEALSTDGLIAEFNRNWARKDIEEANNRNSVKKYSPEEAEQQHKLEELKAQVKSNALTPYQTARLLAIKANEYGWRRTDILKCLPEKLRLPYLLASARFRTLDSGGTLSQDELNLLPFYRGNDVKSKSTVDSGKRKAKRSPQNAQQDEQHLNAAVRLTAELHRTSGNPEQQRTALNNMWRFSRTLNTNSELRHSVSTVIANEFDRLTKNKAYALETMRLEFGITDQYTSRQTL